MTHRQHLLVLLVATTFGCDAQQPTPSPTRTNAPATNQQNDEPARDPTETDDAVPGKEFTKGDLDRIESELRIDLPEAYRRFMLARSKELREYTYPLRGKTELWFDSEFFGLDVDGLIVENIDQRRPDMAAEDTFPGWWKTYFFLGTNGGGDYYGMRLDGTPGDQFLARDGAKIKLYAKSLGEFVAKSLVNYDEELKLYMRLEELYQKKVRGDVNEDDFKRECQAILNSE